LSHNTENSPTDFRYTAGLSLGALGVVYGDIGTSPLYALRECFHGPHSIELTPANVMGILSLVFWALIIVITIKYLSFVMRADNRGEGGILSLMSLIPRDLRRRESGRWLLVALGIFGASLLYGDGMVSPAVAVLSAVEGLQLATPAVRPYVIPLAIVILIGIFLLQRRGTAGIGAIFGPVMLFYFATIAVLGLSWILPNPSVLAAVSPTHAVSFFLRNRMAGFVTLGTVFLVVTGGESLYADMGHFGRKPIKIAWFGLVLPALLINYFGQGALLLARPEAKENPFFEMAPEWALYPMIALATFAAVIASQAVISGAFSLTRQAVHLGYVPRIEIVHTSHAEIGQIYIPSVNWLLMLATIGLVLGFRSSSHLAAAYGVAVTTTMLITTILAFVVAIRRWNWPLRYVLPVALLFFVIDLSFFGANITKVPDGGWFPLTVAALAYTLMATWKQGRRILAERLAKDALPFEQFVASAKPGSPPRVPGTAVFMSRDAVATPTALLHNLKHNKVLHERVILLTVQTEEFPNVDPAERVTIEPLGQEFYRVTARYGFMQNPGVPDVLDRLEEKGLKLNLMSTTFFLSRETLIPSPKKGMAMWRERLFALMSRNSLRPTDFFRIPPNRVIELGMQVRL
jgi:KUP system potassium uptake protein